MDYVAEESKPSKPPELSATLAPRLELEFALEESQLEHFAACLRRSGKVTLVLKNVGTGELGRAATSHVVAID